MHFIPKKNYQRFVPFEENRRQLEMNAKHNEEHFLYFVEKENCSPIKIQNKNTEENINIVSRKAKINN